MMKKMTMMMMLRFVAYIEFVCLALLVIGGMHLVSCQPPGSKLTIKSPVVLAKELDHRDSLFGQLPYGTSIEEKIFYADNKLCDPTFDASKNGFPKREVTQDGKMQPFASTFILLVDRGGCTFVAKIRNAQRLGAVAAIIADNSCLCSDAECVAGDGICETAEPIMADDGSGADISIPSMLIFKTDADALIRHLKNNTNVVMEMSYELPSPDDRVEYDIFTVPTDGVSKAFLTTWKAMAKALGTRAYFKPHMYIYDGVRTHCTGTDGQSLCFNLCTNAGRYCATDPDNDLEKGISGADVVTESLRRICIWRIYGEGDGIGEAWWDYINEFERRCSPADYFANEECIKDAYTYAGVDGDVIVRCMLDSGGLDTDGSNSFLDQAIADQATMGVVVIPTVFVNTVALRGTMSSEAVFGAICSGFAEGSAPEVCAKCMSCPWDLATCVETNACVSEPDDTNEALMIHGDDPMLLGLGMLSGLLESFGGSEICGLNFEEIAEASNGGNADILDSLQLDEQCDTSQEEQFLGTLETFETCAGWDIKEVIETLPSALVGSAMRCAMKAMSLKDDEAFAETIATECAGVVLADNPLGNALKRILLEPEKNCLCMGELSELPECELDVWPIPVFGSGLKTWSCLLTNLGCGFLVPICESELTALDTCLPLSDDAENLCEAPATCEDSMLLSLPQSLAGMPIPDSCRQTNQNRMKGATSNVVARYNFFVEKCVDDVGFWDLPAPSSNYVDQSFSSDKVGDKDISKPAEEQSASTEKYNEELEEKQGDLSQSETSITEEVTTPESTSPSSFLTGLITGCIVTAVVAISVVLYHKKSSNKKTGPQGGGNDKRGLYTSIEMT
ncbi:unnamed protein product [Cylindrotheca closterium]|uniref:PA domain-containing protein n=1 Tax=Cylindrotheca closterium TaxID=2856 RepID=A0AAD2GE91_9STRA|nr:unnamed protein product [Cylindrotheca closterium]